MINDAANSHLISWSKNGESFLVYDVDKLAEAEIPKYFKHSNFTSLVRQLNMYGFHKVTGVGGNKVAAKESHIWEFVHPCVIRSRPELLIHIKRKEKEPVMNKKKPIVDGKTSTSEVTVLREHNMKMKTSLDALKKQNESMWREITEHRHSRMLEQWKMDRVINYFTMLYKNRDSDPTRDFDPRMSKRSRIRRAISVPPLESGNEQSPAKCHSAPPALDVLSPTAVQQTLHAAENSHRNMNEATLGGTDQQLDGPCTAFGSGDPDRTRDMTANHFDGHFMAGIFSPCVVFSPMRDFGYGTPPPGMAELNNTPSARGVCGIKREADDGTPSLDDIMDPMQGCTPLRAFLADAVALVPE